MGVISCEVVPALDVGSENQVQDKVKNVDDVLTPASSFVCTAVFVDGWDFFDGDLNESRPSQELWRGRFRCISPYLHVVYSLLMLCGLYCNIRSVTVTGPCPVNDLLFPDGPATFMHPLFLFLLSAILVKMDCYSNNKPINLRGLVIIKPAELNRFSKVGWWPNAID
ncbi:hypothetical protein T09_7326 [Trichinella sp. T9]|nr:hypothetical protein T09_7326 [Trichinella sp. T9]